MTGINIRVRQIFGIPYSKTVGSAVGIYTVEEAGGSPTLDVSGLPMMAYNGRVYFVRKPAGTPYLASVLFDGTDLRDEDPSDGTKIRLEFFV